MPEAAPWKKTASILVRPLAAIAGIALAWYFIQRAGVAETFAVARQTGVWLPVIVTLQIGLVACDAVALRLLVDDASAPLRTWFRATAIQNACSVLLPMGRPVGEALRCAALAQWVGTGRAARGAAGLQACSLLGVSTACALSSLVAWTMAHAAALALALLVCTFLSGSLGGVVLLLARSERIAAWLRRVFGRFLPSTPSTALKEISASATVRGWLLCTFGRLLQTLQYGIVVAAVGGKLGIKSAFLAEGMQLVGSTAGDIMPSGLGAIEGAYTAFSDLLGLPAGQAAALSIVVVIRGALVGIALAGLVAIAIVKPDVKR